MKSPFVRTPGTSDPPRRLLPRVPLQRGIIILPSAFTLGNLFFGVYAIVAATRGDFEWAGWFIVFAGILDLLDGRVARFTRTGTAFGAELDSLVDAISFGVAPALIAYQLYFTEGRWGWTVCFVYIAASVVRLARFNVDQAGHAKSHFIGLPSPTAGIILATYYPFSRTEFFLSYLADWPWPEFIGIGMVFLGVLMLSHIPYPVVPRIGLGTRKGLLNTLVMGVCLLTAVTWPRLFFFPFLVTYTSFGLVRSVVHGLLDRLPDLDPLLDEEDDGTQDLAGAELRSMDYGEVAPTRLRREPPYDEPPEKSL